MGLDGYTRTCGLIGNPVEHTLSPVIHNYLAANQGENLVYVPFRVAQGRLEDAVKGAYALNLLGCNVTVPYKSQVIPYLADIDPLAARIGAVNTLVRQEGGFKGYNTDMPGLYRALVRDGVNIKGEQVIILGAGGVARAVAMLMAEKGADRIVILNRTIEHARRIAEEVNAYWKGAGRGGQLAEACALEDWTSLEGSYLTFQATNVGMFPAVTEAVLEDPGFYRKVHTGYDLIFNPSCTRFMGLVREAGGKAYGGLGMLLYQGVIAYELWTGRKVTDALADEVYKEMKARLSGENRAKEEV